MCHFTIYSYLPPYLMFLHFVPSLLPYYSTMLWLVSLSAFPGICIGGAPTLQSIPYQGIYPGIQSTLFLYIDWGTPLRFVSEVSRVVSASTARVCSVSTFDGFSLYKSDIIF